MVTKNLNVISKQESLEGKQDAKYIKQAKEELLETLQLDQKMVNRNQLADVLAKNRFENGKNGTNDGVPGGNINIRDNVVIKIDQKKYKDILDEYQKIITEKPSDLEIRLKKLDTLLAERMILDSGNMIEFKSSDNFDGGKPAKEESKIAYDELSKLDEYTGKIDLVSKKDKQGRDYFVIKWTDAQLKEIWKKAKELKEKEEQKKEENVDVNIDITVDNLNITILIKKLEIIIINIENNELKLELEILIGKLKEIFREKGNIRVKNVLSIEEMKAILFLISIDITKKDLLTGALISYLQSVINKINIDVNAKARGEAKSESSAKAEANVNINIGGGAGGGGGIGMPTVFVPTLGGGVNVSNQNIVDIVNQVINNINNVNTNQSKVDQTKDIEKILAVFMEKFTEKITTIITEKETSHKEEIEKIFEQLKEHLSKEHKEIIETIISENKELRERLILIEKEQKEYNERLERIEKNQEITIQKIDTLRSEIDKEMKELKSMYEGLQKDMKILLLEMEGLKQDSETIKRKLAIIYEEIMKLHEKMDALKKKIDECCEEKHEDDDDEEEEEEEEKKPKKLGEVELTATISDTTQITRAIAERQAGEKLRKIYKNTARYKPRSWPTKLTLFLGRGYMKDHYTRQYMNMKPGMQWDENLKKGADRHEIEEENKFNDAIKNVGDIDAANYPRTYQAIDTLAKQMTGDANTMPPRQRGINDIPFQQQFTATIRRNLDTTRPATATVANWKPLAQIIKNNDIQQMSSNITEKLNGFRDHQAMAWNIADHITRNPIESDTSFNAFSRREIVNYFNIHKKNPEFLKTLNIKLDDQNAMKELRRLQAHQGALTQIAAQTMRLKVQILVKGEEAYDVKQERGVMTKIGNRLDKPISDTSRFGKWMEKHPFVKNAFGTLRGITKLGAMITPAILLAPLGPLAVAGGAGGMAFTKTLFKKYAHYNKEHIGYQRNQAVNLMDNTQERTRLMNEMSNMNPASRFFLYYFGLGKKARDVRQFRDYVMTTHDQLANSNTLASQIEGFLNKQQLTLPEQQDLERLISQGLARLDFHKKTGQNFLGSEKKDVAEREYQAIYRLVLTGSTRLDTDLNVLRQNNYYDNEMDLINNGTGDDVDQIGYERSRKRFKHRQTEKALLGAVKAGGIAFGLSYLATNLASTKASTQTTTHATGVKENFVLGGHESAANNGVYTPANTFFNSPGATGHNMLYAYGGGTDATHVIAGHLTPAEYAAKVTEVSKEISKMAINPMSKANLLSELSKQPWTSVAGQTNAALHNMRCVEGLEQIAKALNDSTNAANIIINPHYTPSVFNITSATYNNAAERVVQGGIGYMDTVTTAAHTVPIPIPGYMNTFKEPDRYDEKKKGNEDRQGRKTRTPAPKVDKQTGDQDTRRRSGEDTFTNANN